MIVRHLESDDALVDREALSVWYKRSVRTIRHYCAPVACDVKTRRALYLHSEFVQMDQRTPKRKRLAKDQHLMAA